MTGLINVFSLPTSLYLREHEVCFQASVYQVENLPTPFTLRAMASFSLFLFHQTPFLVHQFLVMPANWVLSTTVKLFVQSPLATLLATFTQAGKGVSRCGTSIKRWRSQQLRNRCRPLNAWYVFCTSFLFLSLVSALTYASSLYNVRVITYFMSDETNEKV